MFCSCATNPLGFLQDQPSSLYNSFLLTGSTRFFLVPDLLIFAST